MLNTRTVYTRSLNSRHHSRSQQMFTIPHRWAWSPWLLSSLLLLGSALGSSLEAAAQDPAFLAEIELKDLLPANGGDGSHGFAINGVTNGDLSGNSVAGAGDVNGDGVDDVLIGALQSDVNGLDSGQSYVVFGQTTGFAAPVELDSLDGSNGFAINGVEPYDYAGSNVVGAGDINGDGVDDVLIGDFRPTSNGSRIAKAYVVFGQIEWSAPAVELSNLNGSNGFTIKGVGSGTWEGSIVAGVGDVNADGVDDVVVGDGLGDSYVIFGKTNWSASSVDLSSLNGSNGFTLKGFGGQVSGAGDVNGDGVDDVLTGYRGRRQSYVVFGQAGWSAGSIDVSMLDGNTGFTINGNTYALSRAKDVNGDGVDDVLIGAEGTNSNGAAYVKSWVVFGQANWSASSVDLSSLDGSNGFVLNGLENDLWGGETVSGVGDVNGDGVDDLLIGSRYASPNGHFYSGQSYVVYGKAGWSAAAVELSSLDGSNGFAINGVAAVDGAGRTSGAGDVNGDGMNDLLIGAPWAGSGQSYVVYGRRSDSEGLLALYRFDAGSGTTVYDRSGVGTPLNLTIEDPDRTTWEPGGGLTLTAHTRVSSAEPATKIREGIAATDAVTLEAWITQSDLGAQVAGIVLSRCRKPRRTTTYV